MFLSAFIAFTAAALHCDDGFRSSDTSTPRSFSRVTLSSSILPFPDFILYALGLCFPMCMVLHLAALIIAYIAGATNSLNIAYIADATNSFEIILIQIPKF